MKIINLKKTILLVLLIIVTTVANAQVTIGSNAEPSSAAILEIKTMHNASPIISITDDSNITSDKGGLGLPRVKLVNRKTLEPFIQGSIDDQTKMKHVGLTVYNIKQQIINSIDESFEPVHTYGTGSNGTCQVVEEVKVLAGSTFHHFIYL